MSLELSQKLNILHKLTNLYDEQGRKNLIPLLPLLKLGKHPMGLEYHYQFESFFRNERPKRMTLKCGRQVGKSYQLCASKILRTWTEEYYDCLFVLPRWNQMKRMSQTIFTKFLQDSPFFEEIFWEPPLSNSLGLKQFKSNSEVHFSHAFMSSDPVRGYSGIDDLIIDEAQDMDGQHLPVIEETVTASLKYGFITYSGTPKSLQNTLTACWEDSSQAEWAVDCSHCSKTNIAAPDEHLIDMIGKHGPICINCGKELLTGNGRFIHKIPERAASHSGYHIPQTVHPHHCSPEYPHKWDELLEKKEKYNEIRFFNEVLGVEKDSAARLITKAQLRKACDSDLMNSYPNLIKNCRNMDCVGVGIDWGGGGANETYPSYTALAVGGRLPGQDIIRILYGLKFSPLEDPDRIIDLVAEIVSKVNPDFIGHDYSSLGAERERTLCDRGLSAAKMAPFTYTFAPTKPIMYFDAKNKKGWRESYMIDKTRSISTLCEMIKHGKVQFPTWESCWGLEVAGEQQTLLGDFMNIYQERTQSPRGNDRVLIYQVPKTSEDWVHAVNFVCSGIWFTTGKYPQCTEVNSHLSDADIEDMVHPAYFTMKS